MAETEDAVAPMSAQAPAGLYTRNPLRLLWLSCRLALHRYAAMLAVGVLAIVPVGVLAVFVLAPVVAGGGAVINGELVVTGIAGWELAGLVGLLVVTPVVTAVAFGGCAYVAAGDLLDAPVTVAGALRAAVRRLPILLVLVVFAAGGVALALAGGLATALLWGSRAVALVVAGLLAFLELPLLLMLPAALLEGRNPVAAVVRALRVTRQRGSTVRVVVLVGVLGVPVLVQQGVVWAVTVSPLDGLAAVAATGAARGALAVFVLPFAAATLAVVFLARPGEVSPRVDRDAPPLDEAAVRARLPVVPAGATGSPTSSRLPRNALARTAGLVVAPLLPGLVYGAVLAVGPLRLPVASDHTVGRYGVVSHAELQLRDGRPVAALPAARSYSIVRCGDDVCSRSRKVDVEVAQYHNPHPAVAVTGGGALLLAAWSEGKPNRDEGPWRLRLRRCDPRGCGDGDSGAVLAEAPPSMAAELSGVAMAATPRGVAVAYLAPAGRRGGWRLLLTRCAEMRCATPRTTEITEVGTGFAELGLGGTRPQTRHIGIAAGPRGPAIVYLNARTREVTLLTCTTRMCRDPAVRRLVRPHELEEDEVEEAARHTRIQVEVTPDGRPVVLFRNVRTGRVQLVSCRSRGCRNPTSATLAPGWHAALELDGRGRPLVATYSAAGDRVVLVSCSGVACRDRTRVPLARVREHPGSIDLAIGADGRPRVLWTDLVGEDTHDGVLHVLTCQRPRCRPGLR